VPRDDARTGSEYVAKLVLVEGLPGSGKTTACGRVEAWAREQGLLARYFEEGRADHPADFEQVSVLSEEDLARVCREFPADASSLTEAAHRRDEYWLIKKRDRADWSPALRRALSTWDSYDGEVSPEVHRQVLLDSWHRFGRAASTDPSIFVFECAFLQNPICALLARFNQPAAAIEAHIGNLAAAVAGMDPMLIYLDAGDPERVLIAAAAERPPAWLDFVIRYHTEQGYGRAHGLEGFAGLVEFLRVRRDFELQLIRALPVRLNVIDISRTDRDALLTKALEDHLLTPVCTNDEASAVAT
jgi:hypothetical protein